MARRRGVLSIKAEHVPPVTLSVIWLTKRSAHTALVGVPLAANRWPHKRISRLPLKKMLREFTDDDGITWRVWDVTPSLHERLSPRVQKIAVRVPSGWLCFESHLERRRLTPIPDEWEMIDERALKRMCSEAEPVRHGRG